MVVAWQDLDVHHYLMQWEMANEHIMVIAMIEDVEGVMAIDDIAQVEGLDMIVEGAGDIYRSHLAYHGQCVIIK